MGKYMRKAKITAEVAVMEVSPQSAVGVRTRARAMALHNPAAADTVDSACYLQLRSRRLEKAQVLSSSSPRPSASPAKVREPCTDSSMGDSSRRNYAPVLSSPNPANSDEVSFGDNVLDYESRERCIREVTPCSLIINPEMIGTPGSTTRCTYSTSNRRGQSLNDRNIPATHEMDEFFAGAEQIQQKMFSDKYNYDPVNDCPLPGRYEWARLDF